MKVSRKKIARTRISLGLLALRMPIETREMRTEDRIIAANTVFSNILREKGVLSI